MAEVQLKNIKKVYPFVSGEDKKKKKKSDEPEKKTSGSALTLDMIAGMVPSAAASPLAEQIMELRKQLAEENITPKGYKLGMEKLLAALQEEKKQQIAALEQALNDELITEKGFASKLSEILG